MAEIVLVCAILLFTLVLFVLGVFPVDLVSLAALALLFAFNLVTPEEGISGFGNPATVSVAAMFVLSSALHKTGLIDLLGYRLIRITQSDLMLLILIVLITGSVSAFVNNTAAVAIFLPAIVAVCQRRNIAPSRFLIPLSYASQFGGVCTLIGTSTNLLVSAVSDRAGYGHFSMFEFAPLGVVLFLVGTLYFVFLGRYLLPERRGDTMLASYGLGNYLTELRVSDRSSLVGKTLVESYIGQRYQATVLEIRRGAARILALGRTPIQSGDVLLVRGKVEEIRELQQVERLQSDPEHQHQDEVPNREPRGMVEALVAPNSRLIGKTLRDINFRRRYNAIVIGIQRRGSALAEQLSEVPLHPADELLLLVPRDEIEQLSRDKDLIVLRERSETGLNPKQTPPILVTVFAVVLLAAFGVLHIVEAALIGCVILAVLGCMSMEDIYRAIDWRVIVFLAGILPLGIAMEKTGAAEAMVRGMLSVLDGQSPVLLLAMIYLAATLLTELISNNAVAVLLSPLAISVAVELGLDPKPFLMAVCFAASTSFATPIGYQTNAMVFGPGQYRFSDYMKVGIPLNILFMIVSTMLIPIIWPFTP